MLRRPAFVLRSSAFMQTLAAAPLRWFVGPGVDDPVWVATVFPRTRDRRRTTDMSRHS